MIDLNNSFDRDQTAKVEKRPKDLFNRYQLKYWFDGLLARHHARYRSIETVVRLTRFHFDYDQRLADAWRFFSIQTLIKIIFFVGKENIGRKENNDRVHRSSSKQLSIRSIVALRLFDWTRWLIEIEEKLFVSTSFYSSKFCCSTEGEITLQVRLKRGDSSTSCSVWMSSWWSFWKDFWR